MWIFSLLFGGNVLGDTLQEDFFKINNFILIERFRDFPLNINVVFVLWDNLCRIISSRINLNFKACQMKVENFVKYFNVIFQHSFWRKCFGAILTGRIISFPTIIMAKVKECQSHFKIVLSQRLLWQRPPLIDVN